REALVQALTAYDGAVVLVSHDMHLLSLAADRLWLVSDGQVTPFEGDLDAYRNFLLDTPAPKPKAAKPQKPSRDTLLAARSEVRKAEARMEKLQDMFEKLQEKLADPNLYTDAKKADRILWQNKFSEVEAAMEKAETLWMAAVETLEGMEH
ncbi:MAG: ABC transporter ATP-binding protein, partial [Pseudomonadota bacterium]